MSRLKATLDFTQAGYDRLEELQEAMGSSSKADVLRSALRLLEYFVKKVNEGHEIALKKDDEFVVVELFGITPVTRTRNG